MKYILTYFILLVCFVSSLTLVCVLPDARIKANIQNSIPVMRQEGIRYKIGSSNQSTLDGFTDRLIAEMQFVVNPAQPFESAIVSHREDGDYMEIIERVAADGPAVTDNYARYWHGYAVWLRPMLMFMNYSQTRIAMNIIFYGLVLGVMFLIYKRVGGAQIVAFAAALCVAYFAAVPMCWQYFSIYLLTLCACIYLLARFKDAAFLRKLPLFMFVVGGMTCFLDLLTAPLLSYGFPAVLAFLVIYKHKYLESSKSYLKLGGKMAIAWGAGYGSLWASKWVVADSFFRLGTMDFGLRKIGSLTYGEVRYNPAQLWWRMPFMAFQYAFHPYELLSAVIFAAAMIWIVWYCIKRREKALSVVLGVALLPLIWYMVAFVHSYAHVFMTFRTLSVTVFAVTAVLICVIPLTFKKE